MTDQYEPNESARHAFVHASAGFGGHGGLDRLFSIRDYVANLWRYKLLFVVAILLGTLWAVYSVSNAPKLYTVSVLVGPVGDAPVASSALSGFVSMFLSGSGPAAQGPPEWTRYVFALDSVRLAEKLNEEHDLIHTVFASRWDAKTRTWKPTPGFGPAMSRFFDRLFGLPDDPPPTVSTLQQYISGQISLYTDKTTGVTSLNMTSGDPKQALDFILMVHTTAVDLVRHEIAARNTAKIDYLTSTISKTSNDSLRSILISMLAETEQTQMLLDNNLPFAAQIIDTPVLPTVPSSPAPFNVLLVYHVGELIFLLLALVAFDQIAGTGVMNFVDTSLRWGGGSVGRLLGRTRELRLARLRSGLDDFS